MSPPATCRSICHAIAGTISVNRLTRSLGRRPAGQDQSAGDGRPRKAGVLDVARLRESFAHVAMHGDELPLFFYSDLFIKHPEVRDLFPISMAAQRGSFVEALVKIVSQVDRIAEVTVFLEGLGRDHRKFGAVIDHYDAVGDSLLSTLEHFSGPVWTPELAADWRTAYDLIGSIMISAARADERVRPPWWDATVVSCERKSFDTSVLLVRPESPVDYVPGQSV